MAAVQVAKAAAADGDKLISLYISKSIVIAAMLFYLEKKGVIERLYLL